MPQRDHYTGPSDHAPDRNVQAGATGVLLVNLGKTDARPRLDPGFVAGTAWTNLLDDGAPAAPDAVLRFRAAVTETAGFYRGSGFIDDTRAFLSIPARHDVARRMDAGWLATLVATGRLPEEEAHRIAADLVGPIPRHVFRLGD